MDQELNGQPFRHASSVAKLGTDTSAVQSQRSRERHQSKSSAAPAVDSETRAYVTSSRVAQGLPMKVTDRDALGAIQRALSAPHETNTIRVEAGAPAHSGGTDNDAVKQSA